mgnify:CR=1 FL=1
MILCLIKNPKSKRDFLFIDDLVEGLISLLEHKKNFDIINFCFGEGHSVENVLNCILNITQSRLPIDYVNDNFYYDSILDNTKAKNLLGWEPKISLEEGLKIVLNNYSL